MRAKSFRAPANMTSRDPNLKGLIRYVQFGVWLKGFTNRSCGWVGCLFAPIFRLMRPFGVRKPNVFGRFFPSTFQYMQWYDLDKSHFVRIWANIVWPKRLARMHYQPCGNKVRWVASKFDECHLSVCPAFPFFTKARAEFRSSRLLDKRPKRHHAPDSTQPSDSHFVTAHFPMYMRKCCEAIFSNNKLWPIYLSIFRHSRRYFCTARVRERSE